MKTTTQIILTVGLALWIIMSVADDIAKIKTFDTTSKKRKHKFILVSIVMSIIKAYLIATVWLA